MAITDREKLIRQAAKPFVDRLASLDDELAKIEEQFLATYQPLLAERKLTAEDVARISGQTPPGRDTMLKALSLNGQRTRRQRAVREAQANAKSADARATEIKEYLTTHPRSTKQAMAEALGVSLGTISNALKGLSVDESVLPREPGQRGASQKVYTLA